MRTLLSFSLFLNAASISAVVYLWSAFPELIHEHLLQPIYERRVSQFRELELAAESVVFLGDSITEEGRWHEHFPNIIAINRGIGGDTTQGVIERLEPITQAKPSKLFLMIGTNDLGLGIDPALIAENIRIIVTSIKTKSPSTEIYVQSVLPRKTRFREKIEELNALVRANTRSMSIWIDLYPIFLDSDGSIRNDLSNDELHLLGDGYALWRDRIARFMVSK